MQRACIRLTAILVAHVYSEDTRMRKSCVTHGTGGDGDCNKTTLSVLCMYVGDSI